MAKWFGTVLVAVAGTILLPGCQKSPPPPPTAGERLRTGFETRYNATVALARRGSQSFDDRHLEILNEMLDEPLQTYNWRVRIVDGEEVDFAKAAPDPAAARTTVETALKAIVELHKKRPELNLQALYPTIQKLTESTNPVLRQEATRTQLALGIK